MLLIAVTAAARAAPLFLDILPPGQDGLVPASTVTAGAHATDQLAMYPRLVHAVFDAQLSDFYPQIPLPFDDAPSDQNLGSAYQDGYYGYLSKVLRQALGRRVRGRYRMLRCADGRHAACAAAVRGSLAAAVDALTGTTSTSRSVARWWLVPCHGRTAPRSSKWCRSDHEAIGGRMTVGGSCLCGDVAFELVPGDWMGHCHCSMCRKAHGAAFATHVSTEATAFPWLRGAERVRRYESSPGAFRPFCERCGSKVPEPPASGQVLVPAGLLDDDPQIRPRMHIFVASKAPWHEIADSLPRFDAYPPGAGEAVPFSRRSEPAPGVARGSCLCGSVAYEIADRVPGPIANCHCSRCRKGRSAAHASNLFVELARFRWLRGEGLLVSYQVPEAHRFTQVFCRTCGASAPRVDAERGRVVVPAGSLDDDPGAREELHIFVGSKAPWYEIADDLPRHEAYPPGPYPPPSRRPRDAGARG